jgi:hypothetical protein
MRPLRTTTRHLRIIVVAAAATTASVAAAVLPLPPAASASVHDLAEADDADRTHRGDRGPSDTVSAGFVRDPRGRYRVIEAPKAETQTIAFGVNDRGDIVGAYDDEEGRAHGFLRDAHGRFRTIDVPEAYATVATRINERGQIVGDYWPTKERFDQGLKYGFLYERGRFTRFEVPGADSTEGVGIDDRGRVVGEALTLDPFGARGYIFERGRFRLIDVPGAAFTGAEEINERGQIVGTYGDDLDDPAATRGYLLDRGRFRTFAVPGETTTQVFGVNNREQIVGYTADVDPTTLEVTGEHGFLFARGPRGPVTPIDVPGAPRTLALGINDHGTIVGWFFPDEADADAMGESAMPTSTELR